MTVRDLGQKKRMSFSYLFRCDQKRRARYMIGCRSLNSQCSLYLMRCSLESGRKKGEVFSASRYSASICVCIGQFASSRSLSSSPGTWKRPVIALIRSLHFTCIWKNSSMVRVQRHIAHHKFLHTSTNSSTYLVRRSLRGTGYFGVPICSRFERSSAVARYNSLTQYEVRLRAARVGTISSTDRNHPL
jgi:hypothetical protein